MLLYQLNKGIYWHYSKVYGNFFSHQLAYCFICYADCRHLGCSHTIAMCVWVWVHSRLLKRNIAEVHQTRQRGLILWYVPLPSVAFYPPIRNATIWHDFTNSHLMFSCTFAFLVLLAIGQKRLRTTVLGIVFALAWLTPYMTQTKKNAQIILKLQILTLKWLVCNANISFSFWPHWWASNPQTALSVQYFRRRHLATLTVAHVIAFSTISTNAKQSLKTHLFTQSSHGYFLDVKQPF